MTSLDRPTAELAAPDPADQPAPADRPPPPPPGADPSGAVEGAAATPVEPDDDAVTFASLLLDPDLVAVLDDLGYEEPTGIQAEAIPHLLAGRDILGQAATGTGKTAAFALPMLHGLPDADARDGQPLGLVLAPTRELAIQVAEATTTYGRGLDARVLAVYGGQPVWRQLKALKAGVDVVVATPGRAVDLLGRGALDLSSVRFVVLDEADEMLDMGFQEDLEAVLDATPTERQTALLSATLPRRIEDLAKRYLDDPVRVTVSQRSAATGDVPRIREVVHAVARHHKTAALGRVLDVEAPEATIVFCRTRNDVDELTRAMNARGYRAEALHGGLSQEQRDRVMERLRNGTTDLLVATDVAARGLDVDHLTHVVNHSLPQSPEQYVHRIGRVGRAGREGVAISLVEPREHRALRNIQRHVRRDLEAEPIPTVADLRERRQSLHTAEVRERLLAGRLDHAREIVEALTEEHDLMEVALAAVALVVEEQTGDADEHEIPDAELGPRGGKGAKGARGTKADTGDRSGSRRDRDDRPPRDGAGRGGDGAPGRIWIGLGRDAGLRPKDVVGAIAGETDLGGRDVGRIQIQQRFALVDVPEARVDDVIEALRRTRIRNKKPPVRRDRSD